MARGQRRTRCTERFSGSRRRVRWQDPYAWCSPPADHADQISITASGGCGLVPACLSSACSVGVLRRRAPSPSLAHDSLLRRMLTHTLCACSSCGSHADSAALGTTPYDARVAVCAFGPMGWCIQRACGATGSGSTSAFLSATTTAKLARQTTYFTLQGKRVRVIHAKPSLMWMCRSLREAARRAGFCLCRSHA